MFSAKAEKILSFNVSSDFSAHGFHSNSIFFESFVRGFAIAEHPPINLLE